MNERLSQIKLWTLCENINKLLKNVLTVCVHVYD